MNLNFDWTFALSYFGWMASQWTINGFRVIDLGGYLFVIFAAIYIVGMMIDEIKK